MPDPEEDDHDVREATNGQMDLAMYRQKPADLVITDIVMPERDGMGVTLALAREFLDAQVIAMSGATGVQSLLNVAKLFGARQTMQKLFTVEEVRRLYASPWGASPIQQPAPATTTPQSCRPPRPATPRVAAAIRQSGNQRVRAQSNSSDRH